MKAVILAGGLGTRLSEETILKPKPMVEIGNMPILLHIMKIYSYFGIKEFIICAGYKSEYIKNYFLNFFETTSDFKIDLKNNNVKILNKIKEDWTISIIDTGNETMTGGRLKRVQKYVGNEDFCFTYGDGLCDVNISDVIKLHQSNKSIATLTAVQTPDRFGKLKINQSNGIVEIFKEKPINTDEWINGGFFVLSNEVFNYIEDDNSIFEKDTLEKLSRIKKLTAYKHKGFWYAMDKLSDKKYLEDLWKKNKAPWKYN